MKNEHNNIRYLKEQRRRHKRERYLKSESTLFQTSSLLFHLVQFVQISEFFGELNCTGLYLNSVKEGENGEVEHHV